MTRTISGGRISFGPAVGVDSRGPCGVTVGVANADRGVSVSITRPEVIAVERVSLFPPHAAPVTSRTSATTTTLS
ncbi:MAG: hypothetical protein M3439_09590 [Chloroflexota bacterium]|nr:hypothetical protein [Chloroflexota bacterium]